MNTIRLAAYLRALCVGGIPVGSRLPEHCMTSIRVEWALYATVILRILACVSHPLNIHNTYSLLSAHMTTVGKRYAAACMCARNITALQAAVGWMHPYLLNRAPVSM